MSAWGSGTSSLELPCLLANWRVLGWLPALPPAPPESGEPSPGSATAPVCPWPGLAPLSLSFLICKRVTRLLSASLRVSQEVWAEGRAEEEPFSVSCDVTGASQPPCGAEVLSATFPGNRTESRKGVEGLPSQYTEPGLGLGVSDSKARVLDSSWVLCGLGWLLPRDHLRSGGVA